MRAARIGVKFYMLGLKILILEIFYIFLRLIPLWRDVFLDPELRRSRSEGVGLSTRKGVESI